MSGAVIDPDRLVIGTEEGLYCVDLDRDGDDIPNRLDMDNDGDGEVDQDTFASNDYIEIDFESLFGNAPVKEPGIKEPTTRPGTKPKKPRRPFGTPSSMDYQKKMREYTSLNM